jgi:hypothetical protein
MRSIGIMNWYHGMVWRQGVHYHMIFTVAVFDESEVGFSGTFVFCTLKGAQ